VSASELLRQISFSSIVFRLSCRARIRCRDYDYD
jgi:hypothetical protein